MVKLIDDDEYCPLLLLLLGLLSLLNYECVIYISDDRIYYEMMRRVCIGVKFCAKKLRNPLYTGDLSLKIPTVFKNSKIQKIDFDPFQLTK